MSAAADHFRERVSRCLSQGNLATLWGVVRKIRTLTTDPNSSSRDLSRAIATDPVLTSRVLRIVNSAVYGFSREISNLDEAIVILGYNQLRNLCTSLTAMQGLNEKGTSDFDRIALWRHSLATATASRLIQIRLTGSRDPDLFVAGILANIGRGILDQHFPEEFSAILSACRERHITILEAEQEILGVTHAEIGYWAAQSWQLSDDLAYAIRHHHGPAKTKSDYIVNLAYVLADALDVGSPGAAQLTPLIPGTLAGLGLTAAQLTDLIKQLQTEFEKLDSFFKDMIST